MTAEPWVSVDQIAEHLGVTRDSIYRWIDRKNLPAHRVGRLWKFQVSEVDGWVRAGAQMKNNAATVKRHRAKLEGMGANANIELDRQRSRR